MTKTRFLNLDELKAPEEVVVKLNGQEHQLKEMSVADFIWAQKNLKKLEEVEDEGQQILTLIEVLHRMFPTIPKNELENLGLAKLNALADFAIQVGMQGAEETIKEAEKRQGEADPAVEAKS